MSAQERRDYFRVDDNVRISYRKLDAGSAEQLTRAIQAGLPTGFQLRAQIDTTDGQLQRLRPELEGLSQPLQQHLGLLEEKIRQLGQVTDLLAGNTQTATICEVSLSGGGIAIPAEDALAIGQQVELCMQLAGDTGAVHALAEVIDCRREGDGFNVAMEFRGLAEADQEAIIRRTMHRQAEKIRSQAR